jgi:PilZ domain
MPIEQRQHIRFSLDIPAVRYNKFGEKFDIMLQQISVGGCLAEWDDNLFTGDEFRMEIDLPNGNRLPLVCKVLYLFEDNGVGVKFVDLTKFEQELVSKIISHRLDQEGLPVQVSAFSQPRRFANPDEPKITGRDDEKEQILERIMSSENIS